MRSTLRNFIKDSFWTIGAQSVSLLSSIIVSFLLPKFITVEQFGYWQYFLLLASYVGIMHLGYGDGLYLKVGGEYWNSLNRNKWIPELQVLFYSQVGIAAIAGMATLFLCHSLVYLPIFLWTAAYLAIENTYKIITMAMMATDQMPFVSKTVIIDKLIMSVIVIYAIVNQRKEATYIIGGYTLSHLIVCVMTIGKCKLFKRFYAISAQTIKEIIGTCKIGFILMLANFAAILIMGLCRFTVEHYWNIEVFSKLSFSITISSFLLFFISQIGYVLFPILKRVGESTQALLLEKCDYILTLLPMVFYTLFFGMYFFILHWLPKYEDSLRFLAFTAPCICYEIRVVLLYNTYFKNIGKIKQLLYINVLTVLFAIGCYSISIYLHNIDMMALSILAAELVKVFIMQKTLQKEYSIMGSRISIAEIINTVGFVICYYYFGVYTAILWYIAIMCFIGIFFKKETLEFVEFIKKIK